MNYYQGGINEILGMNYEVLKKGKSNNFFGLKITFFHKMAAEKKFYNEYIK